MLNRVGTTIRSGATVVLLTMVSVAMYASAASAAPPVCPPTDPACQNLNNGPPLAPPPPPPPPPPGQLAIGVRAALIVPPPKIHTTPRSPTYVQVNTAFWIGGGVWKKFSATGGLPNEVVTVTAKPKSLAWDFGDGSTLTCYSAGSRTDTTTCVHTYQRSSASRPGNRYAINVVMTWDVSWTCDTGVNCQGQTGPPTPMQPALTMPGNAPLAVGEIQSNSSSQP